MNFERTIIIPSEAIVSQLVKDPKFILEFLELLVETSEGTSTGNMKIGDKNEVTGSSSTLTYRFRALASDMRKAMEDDLKNKFTQALSDVLDGTAEEKVVLTAVNMDQLL